MKILPIYVDGSLTDVNMDTRLDGGAISIYRSAKKIINRLDELCFSPLYCQGSCQTSVQGIRWKQAEIGMEMPQKDPLHTVCYWLIPSTRSSVLTLTICLPVSSEILTIWREYTPCSKRLLRRAHEPGHHERASWSMKTGQKERRVSVGRKVHKLKKWDNL